MPQNCTNPKPISMNTSSLLLLLVLTLSSPLTSSSSHEHCQAWLVQSIPTDMPQLARVPGVLSTGDVLRWMAGNSTERLDLIVQYWQLVAQPENPKSGDYGYTEAQMERFGAGEGGRVYKSLEDAADRDVNIRIVQHSGVYPDYVQEASDLAFGRTNVQNVTLLLGDWWGSGIVHTKVWISDGKDIYIGSANNDWKSLTQVKEVGIYLVGCSSVAKKLEMYFNNLWKLSSLNSSAYTKAVWDEQWQSNRKVPCWSHFIHPKARCRFATESARHPTSPSGYRSPLPHSVEVPHVVGYPILSDPCMFHIPLETPGSNISSVPDQASYLSFAPPELSFGKFQADEQAWVDTIKSVKLGGTVRISTMDWLGQSQYLKSTVYWSSLSAAISDVIFSKNATVQLLVADWAHSIAGTDSYLKSLLYSNILCASSKYNHCGGKVEIRYYRVPGYNMTGPAINNGNATGNLYPGYTRVNHGKYAVSDVRAHIGTSNLVWDYFYTTAGVSFGTYNPAIVAQLQDIFDSDWHSPYSSPVEPLNSA